MEDGIDFLVMVAVMAIYMKHFMLKCSHFEVYIGSNIKMNGMKGLKIKEIRPIHDPIYTA